jgi:hypothetical protein
MLRCMSQKNTQKDRPSPNRLKSTCRHFNLRPSSRSSSSSSSEESPVNPSSSSPEQTMCRSLCGKSAAISDTSVVNDEPSEVRVKLKNGTGKSLPVDGASAASDVRESLFGDWGCGKECLDAVGSGRMVFLVEEFTRSG